MWKIQNLKMLSILLGRSKLKTDTSCLKLLVFTLNIKYKITLAKLWFVKTT